MPNVYLVYSETELDVAPTLLSQYLSARTDFCASVPKTYCYSVICDVRDGSIHYATTVTENKNDRAKYVDAIKKGTAVVEGPFPSEKLVFFETRGIGIIKRDEWEKILNSGKLSSDEIQNVKKAIAERRDPEKRQARDVDITCRLIQNAKNGILAHNR
ncbi:MAG: hypothetical protein WC521_05545 [Bdellovibrionales bacterium]|jgi:hypothetical protein